VTLSPKRAGKLTASNFANAIGIGYDSRQKLWRQLTGREEPFQGNAATEWGVSHERDAIRQYQVVTGELVDTSGQSQEFFIHSVLDWLGCTPDGFAGQTVIEAKCLITICPNYRVRWQLPARAWLTSSAGHQTSLRFGKCLLMLSIGSNA